MKYNNVEYPLGRLSSVEAFKQEMIEALNYVGVYCDSSVSFHDLPEYIMQIGGIADSSAELADRAAWEWWPKRDSSLASQWEAIGYTYDDARCTCYRYIEMLNEKEADNYKEALNFSNLVTNLQLEIQNAESKLIEWEAKTEDEKLRTQEFFTRWDGAIVPMIDISMCTSIVNWWLGASRVVHIPDLDTTNVTNAQGIFAANGPYLRETPEFDLRSCTNIESIFYNAGQFVYLINFKNVGYNPLTQEETWFTSLHWCLGHVGQEPRWNDPCKGVIIKYPWHLSGTKYMNHSVTCQNNRLLSVDAFYNYDRDLHLSPATYMPSGEFTPVDNPTYSTMPSLSQNSLYNIASTIRDVSEDLAGGEPLGPGSVTTEHRTERPTIDMNKWYYQFYVPQALSDYILNKGWDIELTE